MPHPGISLKAVIIKPRYKPLIPSLLTISCISFMYEKFLSFLICALHLSKSPGTYIDKLRNPENAPEIKFCFKRSILGY